MEEKKIMEKLEGLEERLSNLEDELKFNKAFVDAPKNFDAKSDKKNPKTYEDTKLHTIINPRQMPVGTISFVGNFESGDGYSGSVFGGELLKFSKILENDTAEMCNILTAFASVERIDILKSLLNSQKTASQLMQQLGFTTTGKLYHHLSFLEKIGAVRKDGNYYHVPGKFISSVLLAFTAVSTLLNKDKQN